MTNFWNNLNDRERWMLAIGTSVLFCYLLYSLLYAPLHHALQANSASLIDKAETLQWMQQAKKDWKVEKPKQTLTSSQLLTALANQLRTSEFQKFPYQLQQTNAADVQLSFEKVPFPLILNWLLTFHEQYAVVVKQLGAERTKASGVVKVVMVLSRAH